MPGHIMRHWIKKVCIKKTIDLGETLRSVGKETKNGMKKVINFYSNGNIEECGYEDELGKQGRWLFYNEKGDLYIETEYLDDKRHGESIRYHDNGNIAFKSRFQNGYHDGPGVEYYENGRILAEWVYNNRVYTPINYWDINGNQLMKNGTGKKIELYGADGELIVEQYYENGKFINQFYYNNK